MLISFLNKPFVCQGVKYSFLKKGFINGEKNGAIGKAFSLPPIAVYFLS